MSSEYPLASLTASGPLRIAITGRSRAGKTELLRHFLHHAHDTIIEPLQLRLPPRPQHPILARLAASRLVTILGRTARLAFSFVRFLSKKAPKYTRHDLLPAPDTHPLTFFDSCGEEGIFSLYAHATEVDVVLFVTRLDNSRADRRDKVLLSQIKDLFGQDVLDRLIIVLTRGCALAPLNLSFKEFVRGRSDLLTSYVRLAWPPVVIPRRNQEALDEHSDHQSVTDEAPLVKGGAFINTAATPQSWEDVTFLDGEREGFRIRPRASREPRPDQFTPAVRSVVAALANDDNTDEGSVSAVPEDFIEALFEAGVHPEDKRTFTDPKTPPIVVVELSDCCPINPTGERILPDGTPWFSDLVDTIAQVSKDAPQKAAQRQAQKEKEMSPPPLKFSSRFREMLRSLSRDVLRIILVQVALLVLVWQIGSAAENAKARKERIAKQDESNVLLELSDEEFDELTRPDPGSGGSAVLRFDTGDDYDPDLDESEEEFFGRADKKRKRDRVSSEEIPVPIPQLSFPFGSQSIPGLDDKQAEKLTEKPSSENLDENKSAENGRSRKDTAPSKNAEPGGLGQAEREAVPKTEPRLPSTVSEISKPEIPKKE